MNKLIVISGPTATGKTKTSIDAAKMIQTKLGLDAAVVNFDSLLFYKELTIGTARPTPEEMDGIEHHLIGIETISNPMNVSDFIKRAEVVVKELMSQNKIVILVGGSAFYLRALIKGMYESPTPPKEIKDKVDALYEKEGIAPFIEFLKLHDPQSLINHHENDHYRLMRAVEHFETDGTKISDKKVVLDKQNPYDLSNSIHPWRILNIYLDVPRDEHFVIITKRVEKMFADGLIGEIEQLEKDGFTMKEKALTSVGYKEVLEMKQGLFENLEQCIERIAISTRQIAKSQRTFFNKITPKESFNPIHDQGKIKERVTSFLKE